MDYQVRTDSANSAKEIKASAHYSYIQSGITLDGSKFTLGQLVEAGQCLVMDDTSKKYEPYTETTPGTFEPGKSNPVILDTNVKFGLNAAGDANVDHVVGEVLVHGAVQKGMLTGVTTAFIAQLAGAIRFVV